MKKNKKTVKVHSHRNHFWGYVCLISFILYTISYYKGWDNIYMLTMVVCPLSFWIYVVYLEEKYLEDLKNSSRNS